MSKETITFPLYLNVAETAEKLHISRAFLYKIVEKFPDFPKPLKLGHRTVRFEEKAVDDWMKKQTIPKE